MVFNNNNLHTIFIIIESILILIQSFIISNGSFDTADSNKVNKYFSNSKLFNIKKLELSDYSLYIFVILISYSTFVHLEYQNPILIKSFIYQYMFIIVSMIIILGDIYRIKNNYKLDLLFVYKYILTLNILLFVFLFIFEWLPSKISTIELMILVPLFFIGMSFGSFINNTGLRISDNINNNLDRYNELTYKKEKELYISSNKPHYSKCPVCNTRLRLIDNIPLFSWLFLKGKCAHCSAPIPFIYIFSEIIFGLVFVFLISIFKFLEVRNGIAISCLTTLLFILCYLNIIIARNTHNGTLFNSLIVSSQLVLLLILGVVLI